MRNVSVGVYGFDELSKNVQDEVIKRYGDTLSELLTDILEDIMKREFNNYTDNLDFELAYSLNYCQGDGVSFTGTVEGKEELFMLAGLVYGNKVPKNIIKLIKWDIIYKVDFVRNSYYYVHKYTVQTNIIENYNMDKDYCHISRAVAEFEKAINVWRLQVCDSLEKTGYDTIENLYSDDTIKNFIEANELEFFIDGRDFL